jgi:phospholipid/cholesterol/gamma-HCH transport system substrate-binding protein
MIFGKTKLEFKVGLFVVMGLVILAIFLMLIGKINTITSGYNVNMIFNFANGVKNGAPVRFAGVDIGVVKNVELYYSSKESKTKVKVISWLRNDIRIPPDSTVWVNTLGLLGEQYIEIMPGMDYSNFLSEGSEILGKDPVPMHEVNSLVRNIATNLNESIQRVENKEGTIGKLLYDDSIYVELDAMVKDLRKNPWKLFYKTKEKK